MKNWEQEKWVIGVSGGSDSMFLLHYCINHQIDVIVAHVNYHKRESSDRDMMLVETVCKEHHVLCYVKHFEEDYQGNFQAIARDFRYAFYKTLVEEHHAFGVLLAHHADDHIETYLMQKERGSKPSYYGIKEQNNIQNMLIYRPLLSYTKEDILQYCNKEQIRFFEDESNKDISYTRNRIRMQMVNTLSREEKDQYIKEIEKTNHKNNIFYEKVKDYVDSYPNEIIVETFKKIPEQYHEAIIRLWIVDRNKKYSMSKKQSEEILALILHNEKNWKHTINDIFFLQHAYGSITFLELEKVDYTYEILDLQYKDYPQFKLMNNGPSTSAVYVEEDDFPLTIRNFQAGDAIELRLGKKKLSRWFIDRKIPPKERKSWPVVLNREGKIILIPGIGCDIKHFSNNSNLFVVK